MNNHISGINIKSFRGIKNLELKDTKLINILTGDNNGGKTSVLEVIRSVEDPGNLKTWKELIRKNNSVSVDKGITYYEGFYDLFDINEEKKKIEYDVCLSDPKRHNVRLTAEESEEEITTKEFMKIQGLAVPEEEAVHDNFLNISKLTLKTVLDEKEIMKDSLYEAQFRYQPEYKNMDRILEGDIIYISPVCHAEGDVYLSKILDYPDMYEQMLQVLKEYDEDIISINYDSNEKRFGKGNYKILSKSSKKALLLNVYGDGMKKAVLLMSAVIAAKDGILLLDEFETAIHTSAMSKTFKWIVESCKRLNVQVFMTSHSKEAIDKLLKCSSDCLNEMAVYTLYKDSEGTSVRRLEGKKAIEAQDEMGLELR